MDSQEILTRKVEELQRFQEITVGRELRMMELKKTIEMLEKKLQEYEGAGPRE